jgi:hypothetical protein
MSKATTHQVRESQLEMENVQVNVQMNVEMKAHDETMAGTGSGEMRNWAHEKKTFYYRKIRKYSETLGPVAEGVDGGLCNIITIHTILIP